MASDFDTVFVNLRVDEDSSFGSSQSKTGTLSSQGTWTWNKALLVGLIVLCIIGIILALLFLIIGKKFKKNKRSTTTGGATTTTKAVVTKGVSPQPKYEQVRNV